MSFGATGVPPASTVATAAAQALAWAFAAKADFGIAPAIAASPITWIFGCKVEAKLTGSIGHQPVASVTPAAAAMPPAFCGGMTFATSALWVAKSVVRVIAPGSTDVTLPPADSDTHSSKPG